MSELLVRPSYILTENEILTVDKFNLMATPVVELAIQDPVNDQNFFRNGNFYSSYWEQPNGKVCPAGVGTSNANYWICFPAAVGTYSGLTASFVQPDKDQVPTTLSASFVQPAVNANIAIQVATTAWMLPTQTPPQKIHIAGGGDYSVVSVADSTHATVKNLGTGTPAAPGATVPTSGAVTVLSSVSIAVGATAWMSPTQAIYIEGGGDYTVLSVTDSTHAVVTNLGHAINVAPGATVQSGGSTSPSATAVISLRSTLVPDTKSLFSSQLKGAASVGIVEYGQQINGDLSATLRRLCTFSGYLYNSSGLTLSPKLNVYTCNAFNNFSAVSLQTTVDLQTCANSLWTYCTATLDLAPLANVANGLFITILLPTGTLASSSNSVNFSRLKFQLGELATEFTDDVGLFITTPSIDSTMLQDGCIARPSLFLPNVVPAGAYMAKSIKNGDIDDGAIDGRTMVQSISTVLTAGFTQPAVAATVSIAVTSSAGFVSGQTITIAVGGIYTVGSVTDSTHLLVINTGVAGNVAPAVSVPTGGKVASASAAVLNLGYWPINKAGDSGIGPGALSFVNDDAVGAGSVAGASQVIALSSANATNDGYMPAISFDRPGSVARSIGLRVDGRFRTVDRAGATGYLLDSVFKVATADVQDKAITLAKLADSLVALLVAPGTVHQFAGPAPPSGWIVCDGAAISRTTFAALFSAIGTYWGAGDNVSTFNIPNFVNRVPVGYGGGATWGFATNGGTSSETLTLAQIPSHNHPLHDPGHSHPMQTAIGAGNNFQTGSGWLFGATTTNPSGTGITIDAQGGGGGHNNMPPYAVLYYIIKY